MSKASWRFCFTWLQVAIAASVQLSAAPDTLGAALARQDSMITATKTSRSLLESPEYSVGVAANTDTETVCSKETSYRVTVDYSGNSSTSLSSQLIATLPETSTIPRGSRGVLCVLTDDVFTCNRSSSSVLCALTNNVFTCDLSMNSISKRVVVTFRVTVLSADSTGLCANSGSTCIRAVLIPSSSQTAPEPNTLSITLPEVTQPDVELGSSVAVSVTGPRNIAYAYTLRNSGDAILSDFRLTSTDGVILEACDTITALRVSSGDQLTCIATVPVPVMNTTSIDIPFRLTIAATACGKSFSTNRETSITVNLVRLQILNLEATPSIVTELYQEVTAPFLVNNTGNALVSYILSTPESDLPGSCKTDVDLEPGQLTTSTCIRSDLAYPSYLRGCSFVFPFTVEGIYTPGIPGEDYATYALDATAAVPAQASFNFAQALTPLVLTRTGVVDVWINVVNTGALQIQNVTLTPLDSPEGFQGCTIPAIDADTSADCNAVLNVTSDMLKPAPISYKLQSSATVTCDNSTLSRAPLLASVGTAVLKLTADTASPLSFTSGGADSSDIVTFEYKVTNDGTEKLANMTISCTASGTDISNAGTTIGNCNTTSLNSSETTICRCSYNPDYDDWSKCRTVSNQATINAAYLVGGLSTPISSSLTMTAKGSSTPQLFGEVLTVSPSPVTEPGVVTITYKVTNNGTAPLTAVTVASRCTINDTILEAGSGTCEYKINVTQSDFDNLVDTSLIVPINATTVSGADFCGNTATADVLETNYTLESKPKVAVTASATLDTTSPVTSPRVLITYTVKNKGNRALGDCVLTASTPSSGADLFTCDSIPILDAGANSTACEETRSITSSQLDSCSFERNVTVTCSTTSPTGKVEVRTKNPTAVDIASVVTVLPALDLTVATTPDLSNGTHITAPGLLTLNYVVTNTGNQRLSNVSISNSLDNNPNSPSVSLISCSPSPSSLDAGALITCQASYDITQEFIRRRDMLIVNVTATGTPPCPSGVQPVDAVKTLGVLGDVLGLSVDVVSDPAVEDGYSGSVIQYTYTLTNTGSVTLYNLTVISSIPGHSAASCSPSTPTLGPGAQTSCVANTSILTSDFNTCGNISNTFTASGSTESGVLVSSDAVPETHPIASNVAPSVELSTQQQPSGPSGEGATITYTHTLTNNGPLSFTNPIVVANTNGNGPNSTSSCVITPSNPPPGEPGTLLPGDAGSCTTAYVITAYDVRHKSAIVVSASFSNATACLGTVSASDSKRQELVPLTGGQCQLD